MTAPGISAPGEGRRKFQVWQDGMCVARGEGPYATATAEAAHYAMIYGQDGPVEVKFRDVRSHPIPHRSDI